MRRLILAAFGVLFFAALSSCGTSYNYYVAGLNRTNLSNYRSFAWMPPVRSVDKAANNLAADATIKDAATVVLKEKGLTLTQRDPDLIISYSSVVGAGNRTYYYPTYGGGLGYYGGFYPGFGMGWGGGFGMGMGWGGFYRPYYYAYGSPFMYGGMTASREQYKEGTLIIDLIDRRSRKIVWRGFGVGEVNKNDKKNLEALPEVVAGVLEQLSLAPSSAAPAGGPQDYGRPQRRNRRGNISPASNLSI
ncbi:DUF4136 domain-containing protein [Mucilaginibacter antarcticus]|uniref:DUF4136 domain-containing protein n=1 Tax=Mucilaginibacter antarcticus TaxID=1855725 RepID=A0ABW5XRY9_9SPHI